MSAGDRVTMAGAEGNLYTRVEMLERAMANLLAGQMNVRQLDHLTPVAGTQRFGDNQIDPDGIHTSANLVDVNWWLPLTLVHDDVSQIYAVLYDATNKLLYAGGRFNMIGGVSARNIAVYSLVTRSWSALGTSPAGYIYALAKDNAGNIYAGGTITGAVQKYTGGVWSAVTLSGASVVYALVLDNLGNLIAAGDQTGRISAWNGSSWSVIGGGANGVVSTLAIDSAGNLYAGGNFTSPATRIAKWDGASWSALGSGLDGQVLKIAFDSAGNVIAGGNFTNYLLKWDGANWSTLGMGVNNKVNAITVDAQDNIIVGGIFTNAGEVSGANRIAKWNGLEWAALDDNGISGLAGYVYALAVDDNGNIIAGGDFDTAGTIQTACLAIYIKSLSDAIDLLGGTFEQYDAYYGGKFAAITAATVPFTPAGNLSAVNVQAALQELDTEKISLSAATNQQMIVKPADEIIINSTTLQNDDDFVFALEANKGYFFELTLRIGGNATMDFQCGWTVPSGTTMRWGSLSGEAGWNTVAPASTPGLRLDETQTLSLGLVATNTNLRLVGWIFTGANAGNLQFKWAQNTAAAFNLTVQQWSYMTLQKLSTGLSTGVVYLANQPAWGGITGTLSNQSDLQTALNAKVDKVYTDPTLPSFSWVNQGTATLTTVAGKSHYIYVPAGAGVSWKILDVAAPATPYTVTACFAGNFGINGGTAQFGLVMRDSVSGKFASLANLVSGALDISKWTSPTAFSAAYSSSGSQRYNLVWLRMKDDGANRISYVSTDGVNWIQLHSVARTDFVTANRIGWGVSQGTGNLDIGLTLLSWNVS